MNPGSQKTKALIFFWVGVLIFVSESGFAQEAVPGMAEFQKLKRSFTGTHDLLIQPIKDLNKNYLKALDRLLKQEADAGRLDSSLQVKAEIAAFGMAVSSRQTHLQNEPRTTDHWKKFATLT